MVPLSSYLIVAAILFSLGVIGLFLNRKNVITILMCIELILLAVNINLVAFWRYRELLDLNPIVLNFDEVPIAKDAVKPRGDILRFGDLKNSIHYEDG